MPMKTLVGGRFAGQELSVPDTQGEGDIVHVSPSSGFGVGQDYQITGDTAVFVPNEQISVAPPLPPC